MRKLPRGILEAAEETLPAIESPQCNWMSPETKLAIDKKHKIRKQKGHKSAEYKAAKAESKKSVQKDRLKQVEEQIDVISTLPLHKQYYAAIKRLKSKPKNISWGVKNKEGEVVTDKEKILERWAEFYEELYADDPSTVNIDDSCEEAIPNFLKCEVETAINELKIGKSPGLDQIYS